MTPDKPITIAWAVIGCFLALVLPKRWALLALAAPIVCHTSTLLLPPDGLSLTAQRVVAIVLLMRCIFTPSIRSTFRWRLVDTAAALYFVLITASQVLTTPVGPALNNRAGFFLQALVPFWCARFLITDRESFYNIIKGMLWMALPLSILGFLEMQSNGWNPWDKIRDFGILKVPRKGDGWRIFMGEKMARARGPFLQYIMFGWYFAILVVPATAIWFHKNRPGAWVIPWCFLPLGIITSIASGPMMLAGMAAAIAVCYPLRQYWKFAVGTFAALFCAALLYSNRGFMEIVSSFGFDPLSSWYRHALVRYTLDQGGMRGHWIFGYGTIPPEYNNYHDLCIHWVWLLVVHGVVGLIGFYGLISAIGWGLWKAKDQAGDTEERYLIWTMMATLVASLGAMLVVALFAEMYYIYHLMLGLFANAPLLVSARTREVGVLAEVEGRRVLFKYRLRPGQQLALVPAPQ